MWQLTTEQQQRRDRIREVVLEQIRPRALDIHESGDYPRDLARMLGSEGMLGLEIPERFGGGGETHVAGSACIEEIARVSGSVSLMAAYVKLTALPILIAGSEEQQGELLPRLCSGQWLGSYAVTEPEVGSNVADLRCRAERTSDGWVLNGEKKFIGNAGLSDLYVVFARTSDDGAGGISVFWVPGDAEGLEAEPLPTMGMPGWQLGAPRFDDVEIPAENILGDEGEGFKTAMLAFDRSRLTVAAQAVGVAQGAIDLALDYALRRHTFGVPIAQHQGIQFKLAGMEADVAAARALAYQAASLADDDDPRLSKLSSAAKLVASDTAMRVTTEAVQVLGGNGYLENFPAERMMRDAKVLQIYEGANEIQRLVIARAMGEEAMEREPIWPEVMPGNEGIATGAPAGEG